MASDQVPAVQTRDTLIPAFFGEFGGQYVPEQLLPVLDELERAYVEAVADPDFLAELDRLQREYLGRPTPVTECANLPLEGHGRGRARIFLKREDLAHGGAHKGNQVLAQALLAKRLGKTRLIAETGAGRGAHGHGVHDLHGGDGRGPPAAQRAPYAPHGGEGRAGDQRRGRLHVQRDRHRAG